MKKTFLPLFCIIIIASFFRLYHLRTLPPGLYPDEAMNGNNALEALRTGNYKLYYPENNGREGLFMNIQSLFLRATGLREPWVMRLPSALFGIFTVLGLYFLGKELVSREVGLLAAFFLATNFWHINFSRIGFRAIMAPFFLVWGIYLFLRILKKTAYAFQISQKFKNRNVKLHGFTAMASRETGFYAAEPRTESHASTGLWDTTWGIPLWHPWLSGAWVKK